MKTTFVSSKGILKNENLFKPKDLISFSKEYLIHKKEMISFLKNKKKEIVSISLFNMEPSGFFYKREISGVVVNITSDVLTINTNQNYYFDYDYPEIVNFSLLDPTTPSPALTSFLDNPFSVDENHPYFFRLKNMVSLAKNLPNKNHKIKLFYGWDDEYYPNFNHGDFFIEGEIVSVYEDGVKIKSSKTSFVKDNREIILNNIPSEYYWKFISPEFYLRRVISYVEGETDDI